MRHIFLLFMFIAIAVPLCAQSDANKGQIVGTVYDPVQALVPNAKVQVQNKATGAVREFTTGPEGQFRAILLDAGSYDVRVDAQGFARRVYQNVTVNVGSAVSLDVTLQLGGADLEINVADTFLPVDLPNPTTTIDMTSIEDLPINGRRFQDFATLTPTVQVDQERGQLSFLGQRGINANVMVDGSDYNNPFFGGIRGGERSNFIVTVPQSSVQEFQAVTAGYSPEYGRSSGGVVEVPAKFRAHALDRGSFYPNRRKGPGEKAPLRVQNFATPQTVCAGAGGGV